VLVDTRDDTSGKHALRVGVLSRNFAMHLGLPAGAADAIELSARLHDIGKVFIPDRILLKPGPLDKQERGAMEQHTVIGAQLLSGAISQGRLLARLIARFHHECWDGNGYPMGLPGEQIPYIVRLVTVVDVFDALVNERPYKRAWDHETTTTWMLRQAGKQFDPVLVKEFVEFLKPHRGDIPALLGQLEACALSSEN
jgi:response regulator RpfG family c-di-GMP phosphodiesterase